MNNLKKHVEVLQSEAEREDRELLELDEKLTKLSDDEMEVRMLRGRRVLAELQRVLTLTFAAMPTARIAREMGISRPKVMKLQQLLDLRPIEGYPLRGGPWWARSKKASTR